MKKPRLLFVLGMCCGTGIASVPPSSTSIPSTIPVLERFLDGELEKAPLRFGAFASAFRLAVRPDGKPLIIAHRGASGYLPEHTLAAYAAAYFMGADVIEPDVVLTKDGVPICSHDITLDETTDIAQRFPGRARDDGKHYAIDFTLAEIKTLEKLGRESRVRMRGHTIPTLGEMIGLVQNLNERTGRTVGIIPEPKKPEFHRGEDREIERVLVETLASHGYTDRDDPCVIQCFDLDSLWMMRDELGCDLTLAFVFGEQPSRETLDRAAEFCDAFGPKYTMLIESPALMEAFLPGGDFERFGLYPWTFGDDPEPAHEAFRLGVAGIFIDYTDVGVAARDRAMSRLATPDAPATEPVTPGSGRPRTRPSAP